jgi:hypothetical protein
MFWSLVLRSKALKRVGFKSNIDVLTMTSVQNSRFGPGPHVVEGQANLRRSRAGKPARFQPRLLQWRNRSLLLPPCTGSSRVRSKSFQTSTYSTASINSAGIVVVHPSSQAIFQIQARRRCSPNFVVNGITNTLQAEIG